MPQYYQGQRAVNPQTGETVVYDVKKGWQAVDQLTSKNYSTSLKDVQAQKDSYGRMKNQAPLLQQADRMLSNDSFLGFATATNDGKVKSGGVFNQDGEKNRSWAPALSPDADRFSRVSKQIQSSISPPPGQGAVSDYERSLFAAESPSLDSFVHTNRDAIARRQSIINEQRDYANFLDDYVRRKGTSDGAAEVWQRYIAADPYAGPSSKDPSRTVAYSKDPNRWSQFINQGYRPVARQAAPAPGQKPAGPPRLQSAAPKAGTKLRYNPQTRDFE